MSSAMDPLKTNEAFLQFISAASNPAVSLLIGLLVTAMTMPTALPSCMMPELTKPTTMTVVAEEDWITAVTSAPSSTPFISARLFLFCQMEERNWG